MPKTIYITDATSALGHASAIRLGRAGWNIVMGGASMAALRDICCALPDDSTLPMRCVPVEVDNIRPVLEAGHDRFGAIDGVLICNRARHMHWRHVLDQQVMTLAAVSEAAHPHLVQSEGHLIISAVQAGSRTMRGAMRTVSRQAQIVMADALREEWRHDSIVINLIDPGQYDGPKSMARQVAAIVNDTALIDIRPIPRISSA